MILGSLNNTATAEKAHPLFKKAFDYLKTVDLNTIKANSLEVELEGTSLYLFVSEYQGKRADEAKLEAHKRYIDIQVPITGKELMGWLDIDECNEISTPYDPEKDLVFYHDHVSTYIPVSPGEFAIFFPEDGHAPGIGEGYIKKVVIKVIV